jgi:LppP/LprE lipoprotein
MRARRLLPPALALALGLALGGCGGGTKTVTAASAPVARQTAPASTRTTTKAAAPTSAPTSTTPAQTTTDGGASAPTATRTASAPAFTKPQAGGEGLGDAEAVVQAKGYSASQTSDYHPDQTLRVLIGTRSGSSDGYGQQAFFFIGGKYLGTDSKQPSATVKVVSQSDTAVTLAYPLYRSGDPLANPSGGQATVRFELNNGQLTPVGKIPPASSTTGLSRN